MPRTTAAEVVVVGGGPTGLTAAIALASAGIETILVARRIGSQDCRTTALLTGSMKALERLAVWDHCAGSAAPLRVLRIVDSSSRLLRAPEVSFAAAEIGLEAFAYNIENRSLLAALETRAGAMMPLRRIDDEAEAVVPGEHGISIRLKQGCRLDARLVVGADGRHSICRAAAGIETSRHDYPQSAIVLNLAHGRPHLDTSTEFHTETGPLTFVPLPGQRSSMVLVTKPEDADRLAVLSDQDFAAAVERRSYRVLGAMSVDGPRGLFRLSLEVARSLAGNRIALIGEAAHVMPPIGAQGLNIGLRDAACIAELVVEARRNGRDVGARELTEQYELIRRADVMIRSTAVDLLNRSLLSDFLPTQGLRGLGLYLLSRVGPLRRALMREGVAPAASQPRLMRGEAL